MKVGGDNCTVTQNGDALEIEGTGYYPQACTGAMLGTVDMSQEVSVDFVIEKMVGLQGQADSWFSFGLFNKKVYMDINDASKTEGIVFLIRPTSTGASFGAFSLIEGGTFGSTYKQENIVIDNFKAGEAGNFTIAPDEAKGYKVTLNGQEIDLDLTWLKDAAVYADNQAYLSVSLSDDKGNVGKIVVQKVNGEAAASGTGEVEEPAEPEPSDPPESSDAPASSAAPADPGSSNAAPGSTASGSSTTSGADSGEGGMPAALIVLIVVVVVALVGGGIFFFMDMKKKKASGGDR